MGKGYVKTPTIYQMEATECGAASLSMIFAYFGRHMALEQMRIETGVSRDGCNAKNIMVAGRKYGLEVHAYSKDPEGLKELPLPCIIHWNFNHFVVFEGIKGKYAYLNDPAIGRRKISMEELDDGFTGIVLTFQPTESFTKQKKADKLTDFIKERLHGQYSAIGRLIFTGLLLVIPGLLFPVLTQIFMDEVLFNGNRSWLFYIIMVMLAVTALKVGLSYYKMWLLQRLKTKMTLTSSYTFLHHLFKLPIAFFDQRYAGDLTSRVDNNENVNEFLAGELAETVLNLFVAAFYLILLIIYSPVLTAIGGAAIAVKLLIVKLTSGAVSNLMIKQQQDSGKLSGAVCAGLSITETLKASGAENEYISRTHGYHAKTVVQEQKLSRLQQIVNAIPSAIGNITDVIILMVGAWFVIRGNMTVGMLVAFTSLFSSFSQPVDKLVEFINRIQQLKADMSRVDDILNYKQDEKFEKNITDNTNEKLSGDIELKDISFGYSRLNEPLVEDFNFDLKSGSSIAFVGASGCGKSTVSKLISGLYTQWSGEILFDGKPSSEISNEVLSASISTVSQSITLFSGSIKDNLTMWNRSVLDEDLVAAAKDACIYDVIVQKPGAFDYKLTEGASNLSGGQRQRLEIARALVTNPTILVMDEATSALDPIVEKQVIDNIKRRGCTCVIVAHRLSAIRDCDQIIVMENGHIVQRGTHEELENKEGHYKRLISNM